MEFALYLLTGAFAGILSGMLGVGGGLIVVPMLLILLTHQQVAPQHLMQLALGTSLATIAFTAAASARAHQRRGSIRWEAALQLAPGILIGAALGAWFATRLDTSILKAIFVVFLVCTATQLLLSSAPTGERSWPGRAGIWGVGTVIGVVSSLVGIGGGTLSVPFLLHCRSSMREAIGTSAFLGLPIALTGTLTYILLGWHVSGLPQPSLGLVYLPAVAGIAPGSVLCAPFGVWLAHRTPVKRLRRLFALLLYALAAKMIWSLF